MKLIYKIIIPLFVFLAVLVVAEIFFISSFFEDTIFKEKSSTVISHARREIKEIFTQEDLSKSTVDEKLLIQFDQYTKAIEDTSIFRVKIWNKHLKIVYSNLAKINSSSFEFEKDADFIQPFFIKNSHDKWFLITDIDKNSTEYGFGSFLDIVVPIQNNLGETIYAVEFFSATSAVLSSVQSSLNKIIYFSIVFGLFIFAIMYNLVYFIVIKPVVKLDNAAKEIGKGNLIKQLASKSKDEIGKLTRDFDSMRSSLKIALENLKEERDLSQAIISSMGEGLFVVDKDNKIILLNLAAEKMLGVPFKKAEGRNIMDIFEIFKGDKNLLPEEKPLTKTIKTGQSIAADLNDNYYFQTASGKKISVALATAPLIGNGITGAVVVFKDITEEKKLGETKDSFISIASHQLRTPLTAIRWFSEMLISGDAGELTKDQKDFVDQIYRGVLRLTDLIGTLLSLARIEGGRVKVEPILINLVSFSKGIISEVNPFLKEKKLTAELIESNKIIPEIFLDPSLLRQVILNLVSNSIRYTNEKGKIEINIEPKENHVIYSVKDNGIGVPDSQKDKIFEKFFRAENALAKVPEGTGLGLNFIKSIIEMWQGKIWFETEEGKGSVFYFSIPFAGMKAKSGEKGLAA